MEKSYTFLFTGVDSNKYIVTGLVSEGEPYIESVYLEEDPYTPINVYELDELDSDDMHTELINLALDDEK